MYWDRYIRRDNPRRIEPLDKPLDTYIMLDMETTPDLIPRKAPHSSRSARSSYSPAMRTAGRDSNSSSTRDSRCRNSSPDSPASPTKCSRESRP